MSGAARWYEDLTEDWRYFGIFSHILGIFDGYFRQVPGWRPASTQLTIRFNPRSNHNVVIDVALKETKDERRAVTKVVYRNRDWGFRDRMLQTNVVWIDVRRRLGAQSAAFLQQFADSGVEFLPSCYGMEAGRSVMERIRGSDLFMTADCTTQKDRWASDYMWLTGAQVSFAFPRNSPACAVTMVRPLF